MQTTGIFGIYHACHPQTKNHNLAIFPTRKYVPLTTWRSRLALPIYFFRFLGRGQTFLGGTEKPRNVSRSLRNRERFLGHEFRPRKVSRSKVSRCLGFSVTSSGFSFGSCCVRHLHVGASIVGSTSEYCRWKRAMGIFERVLHLFWRKHRQTIIPKVFEQITRLKANCWLMSKPIEKNDRERRRNTIPSYLSCLVGNMLKS